MQDKIAINIDTSTFYSVINFLKDNDWKLIAEYRNDIYDKAIDFDLYQFKKEAEIITMVWDNWDEGAIKSSEKNLLSISNQFNLSLQFQEDHYLRNEKLIKEMGILIKHRENSFINFIRRKLNL